jgi:hemerythrin
MTMLTWTEDLSVGVRRLDEDHKKLIAMINELHAGLLAGHGNEVLGVVLRQLASYTVEHFQREEAWFDETGYPGAAAHRREHEALKAKVMAEIGKFQAGSAGLGMETLNFLRDWLQHHIRQSDQAYGPHLNAHGIN